jgi:chromosome partitioning protein
MVQGKVNMETEKPKKITANTKKGGLGRTKSIFNTAAILAETDPVLLADIDPECHLSFNVGVDVTQDGLKSIKDVFEENAPPEIVIVKSPIEALPNLDIIPSSLQLEETNKRLVGVTGRERILDNFILNNLSVLSKYKYIFIDHNSSDSIINENALFTADSIIMIIDVDNNSVRALDNFIAYWENARKQLGKADDNIKALIINNYDTRIGLASELAEYCEEHEELIKLLIDTVIPYSVRIKETSNAPIPINLMPKARKEEGIFREIIKKLKQKGAI